LRRLLVGLEVDGLLGSRKLKEDSSKEFDAVESDRDVAKDAGIGVFDIALTSC
jgi:hypothetical protein